MLLIMKGFEISYSGDIAKVAIKDGLLMIHASHLRGEGNLYVGGVDYESQAKVAWYDNVPLNIGTTIDIKFTEIDHLSEPVRYIHDESVKRPFSKLEMFLGLEQYLKNNGLL